jgi:hypothetical protein
MQILKKTERSKNNYLADTAPSVKTYDLDKLVQERKAISKIGIGGFTYNCTYCNSEFDNSNDYYVCDTKCFMKRYLPNFIRELYPELTKVEESKVVWNYETLLLLNKSEPMKFCLMISKLESEMIAYQYGDLKVQELKENRNNEEWSELVQNVINKINLESSK